EASVGIEFNFWEFDLHRLQRQFSPYIYAGVAGLSYRVADHDKNDDLDSSRRMTLAFPFGLGVKGEVLPNLVVGAEIIARYSLVNDIDGSYPEKKPESGDYLVFGDYNTNDWYVFSGITLTYTFGKRPCNYCYD